jgi:hypothetical protein
MEAYEADKAEPAADRLLTLMPAAGHMVHMPAHIYQRVGRYADAARSNELAIAADEDYISQCRAQGLYPMAYYPHNLHFLWFAATAEGRSKLAIEAARKAASQVNDETLKAVPLLAGFRVVPYFALTRFGKWDEMLREPEPPASARTCAASGITRAARRSSAKVKRMKRSRNSEVERDNGGQVARPTAVLAKHRSRDSLDRQEVLAARLPRRKRITIAVSASRTCSALEDALVYTEPSEFHYPPRHALGAMLLAANALPKPKLFTGKTCAAIAKTAGRCTA